MKRSRSIRLALLGTAGLFGVVACDQADDPLKSGDFFASAQACEAAHDQKECREAYSRAESQHVVTAPKFANREACEAEVGAQNCGQGPGATGQAQSATGQAAGQTAHQGGGSWFMPAMMGFMMGRMMGGGYGATPLYRDTRNTAYTGRQPLGTLDSSRMPPPQRVAGTAGAPSYGLARAGETSRGGFGRTGSSASS